VITFGGINYTRRDLTVEASCGRLVEDLAKLIRAHGYIVVTDAPMTLEAFAKIRQEAACESAELVVAGPAGVRKAQVILGLGGWITANKSLEATFAYTVLASRVTHYLTDTVWKALLHWANYLVSSKDIHLTFRGGAGEPDCLGGGEGPSDIVVSVDSSAHNGGEGKSYGGYAFSHGNGAGRPTSGAFAVKCLTPKALGGSSAATELVLATEALKTCLGWRMLMREIGFGCTLPTPFGMDANAVLMGTKKEKVSRVMKYMGARYAMLRDALEHKVISPHKIPTELNCADLFTKPLVGERFRALRALLLGLDPAADPARR
jgi:hypothetical protein